MHKIHQEKLKPTYIKRKVYSLFQIYQIVMTNFVIRLW